MILDRIISHKKKEIELSKKTVSLGSLREICAAKGGSAPEKPGQGKFSRSLRKGGEVALIAEIKKASPSKGLIRSDFNPRKIAGTYAGAGASAISVLTDSEFFQGSPEYLGIAKQETQLPLLRKDFIIDSYQIYEAKVLGADAILLIMAVLTDSEVINFLAVAAGLGMDCLVEVHTEAELVRALALEAAVIGINNRNLRTFETDLTTTFKLREKITDPAVTVVSESGINTREAVLSLKDHGVHAMLVGEALMRESDIAKKIAELLGRDQDYPGINREVAL